MIAILLLFLLGILGIISIGCYVVIVIKMFQHGDPLLGGISLGSLVCLGLGFLVAFVLGWVNVDKYQARQLMMIWTGVAILSFVLGGGSHFSGALNQ